MDLISVGRRGGINRRPTCLSSIVSIVSIQIEHNCGIRYFHVGPEIALNCEGVLASRNRPSHRGGIKRFIVVTDSDFYGTLSRVAILL